MFSGRRGTNLIVDPLCYKLVGILAYYCSSPHTCLKPSARQCPFFVKRNLSCLCSDWVGRVHSSKIARIYNPLIVITSETRLTLSLPGKSLGTGSTYVKRKYVLNKPQQLEIPTFFFIYKSVSIHTICVDCFM